MPFRANYRMVAEDDAGWVQFWEAYPRRCAKKDARKAWAELNPSPELVARIVAALEWQVPTFQWDGAKADYAPYPASYLRAERYDDEPPRAKPKADIRGHVPPCRTNQECLAKIFEDAKKERESA